MADLMSGDDSTGGPMTDATATTPGGTTERTNHGLAEAVLESVVDVAVAAVGEDLRVLYVNSAAEDFFGLSAEELLGQQILELQRTRSVAVDGLAAALGDARRGGAARFEVRLEREEPHTTHDVSVRPLFENGRPRGWVVLAVDISRRKAAEAGLRYRERQLTATLDAAVDPILVLDDQGRIRQCNDRFVQMIGAEGRLDAELGAERMMELLVEKLEDRDAFVARIDELNRTSDEHRSDVRTVDGRVYEHHSCPLVESDGPSGRVWTFRDVTERDRSERNRARMDSEARRAERLQSLEVMAGGIAHDFNNLLTGVLGHAEVAQLRLKPDHPVFAMLSKIRAAAERAATLSRQMLTFVGQTTVRWETVDVASLINGIRGDVGTWVGGRLNVRFDMDSEVAVDADPAQLRELMHQLVANAVEAATEGTSGTLTVGLRKLAKPPEDMVFDFFAAETREGSVAEIRVEDDGEGIPSSDLDRIFEPFYSTRFTGRGLGLASVLGIVRAHSGGLAVQSRANEKTVFSVLLPALDATPVADSDTSCESAEAEPPRMVLVVDDEPLVRELGEEIVSLLGWIPVTAADGEQALEVARRHPGAIALAIVDLTMPGLSGVEVHRRLKERDPKLPVVIASGYAENDVRHRFGQSQPDGFLAKPFEVAQIRELLDIHGPSDD
jgi:two-component system cell cycle sensor histidine kinase/response regulator CckA